MAEYSQQELFAVLLARDLRPTDRLVLKRAAATRGAILDGAGQPLVSSRPVVVVGVEPRQVIDKPEPRSSRDHTASGEVGGCVQVNPI